MTEGTEGTEEMAQGAGGTAIALTTEPTPASQPAGPQMVGPRPSTQALPGQRSRADRFARWALRVREPVDGQEVHNLFSASMALSGTRCLLTYIVFPVLAPWLSKVPLIGPAIGIPVGLLALGFDVRAMRRFFQSDHRWRWVAAIVYLAVMAMVASLVAGDISRLT